MENYKEQVSKLEFDNIPFEDLPVAVGEKVNEIIMKFPEYENDIINALVPKIKIVYLIGELESSILNDGLLSVFYNSNLNEIMRIREAIEQTKSKKLLNLFDKAKSLFEKEYTFKSDTNFVSENPDTDIYDFFSENLTDKIEEIEEKITELQDNAEYWNKIEKLF